MQCPHCQLDKPYVKAGVACPHCGRLVPAPPPVVEPETATETEPEAANDTEIPLELEPVEIDQDVEASDPAEGLLPPDEFDPDADPDESG